MINQLGRYEIVDELGQGAMGVVYRAKDPLIDRVVAIKTINLNLATDEKEEEEYEARFYQEAKAAGRLSHPNIVTVYDVGRSEDVAYIAMEFLQGRELRDILKEGQALPVRQVIEIVAQVASGMAYAHEHGIVHRDIKPSNVMVSEDGHVKITDFGIARISSSSIRTQTGMILGSPKYMSPEQVLGKPLDQRTDIFSLGVMLYEMLTGRAPFRGENINAIMFQTINATPVPPSTLNQGVPPMLDAIITRALAKKVEERYQYAREFAADLRKCLEMLPISVVQADHSKQQGDAISDTSSVKERAIVGTKNPLIKSPIMQEDIQGDRTLKVARPKASAMSQAATKPAPPVRAPDAQVTQAEGNVTATGKPPLFLVIVLVLLVLIILVLVFAR